jgi:hypothetical protein
MRRPVALVVVCLAACGENSAEKQNRQALAPLLQRNEALNAEIRDAARTSRTQSQTWQTAFTRAEQMMSEKEAIRKDLRSIVPTEKYACLIGVFQRSLGSDLEMLRAADGVSRQVFRANNANEHADKMLGLAREAMTYGGTNPYLQSAKESNEEAQEAVTLAAKLAAAESTAARVSLAQRDTLRTLILRDRLLPSVDVPEIITGSTGRDSVLRSSGNPVRPACPSQS